MPKLHMVIPEVFLVGAAVIMTIRFNYRMKILAINAEMAVTDEYDIIMLGALNETVLAGVFLLAAGIFTVFFVFHWVRQGRTI